MRGCSIRSGPALFFVLRRRGCGERAKGRRRGCGCGPADRRAGRQLHGCTVQWRRRSREEDAGVRRNRETEECGTGTVADRSGNRGRGKPAEVAQVAASGKRQAVSGNRGPDGPGQAAGMGVKAVVGWRWLAAGGRVGCGAVRSVWCGTLLRGRCAGMRF